jgi:hypothetical protein
MPFAVEYVGSRFFSFHRPDGPLKGAAVLCGPLFHEYYKAHAWLWEDALELSAAGWFVTRFDYSGHGDSPVDAANLLPDRRIDDVRIAAEVTRQRSGCPHLDLLTVRLANLLQERAAVGQRLHVSVDAAIDGGDYLQALRRKQRELVERQPGLVAPGRATEADDHEELMGDRYPVAVLEAVSSWRTDSPAERDIRSGFSRGTISLERALLPDVTREIVEAFTR